MTNKQQNNPFETLTEMWTEGAKAYTDAVQSFFHSAAKVARDGVESVRDDPVEATRRSARQWGEAAARLTGIQQQFLEQLMENLPQQATERLDSQTFRQLTRMAAARWQEEVRRLSEVPAELGERLIATDPQRIQNLLESMSAEYLRDMETIKSTAMEFNIEPLTKAWEKFASGQADESDKKTVDRLLEAMSTKLKFGSEYYADPDRTPVGQTPRELVHEVGKIELYRYTPLPDVEQTGEPVLIVYSIINKPYILDLLPKFSFVEHLLEQGLDVYMIDWGETEPGDNWTTLDSYIDPGIRQCIQYIKDQRGEAELKVSLFGHCIGGNLALLYASLYPDDVARVLTLTTPGTAAKGGVVALWTDKNIFPVDAIIDSFGHMPAKLIRYTFMAIKPYYEVLKWKMFMENLHDDNVMTLFYPIDRWANENVDLPGEVFRKFIIEVFHADRFRRGETVINGKTAALSNVKCPFYNLAASKDWIVPAESAEVLGEAVGSDERYFTLIEGAHVGIMIDPRARPIWTQMSDFLHGKAPEAS